MKSNIYYDSIAKKYDTNYSDPMSVAENIVLAEILGQHIKGTILDVGCGTGLLHELCGKKIGAKNITGIDISPEMINIARSKFPTARFLVGSLDKLPFADATFDTVVSLFGPISYALDPQAAIQELLRVTRPGGTIFVMPYTIRTKNNLEIGTFSTATDPHVDKIFYDRPEAEAMCQLLDESQIIGFNFSAHAICTYAKELYGKELTEQQLADILRAELTGKLTDCISPGIARHMIIFGKKPTT